MLTKFNSSNDMNTVASDAIHSYIKDGYRIDAKESVIDRDKDKDCTFKAVLKKDVDGIECKTVITLTDNGDDKNKACTYHKVETVGDTKWSEETRSFSSSTDKTKLNSAVKNHVMDNLCKTPRMWWDHADDNFYDYYHDTVRNIFKDFGLHCDWFGDDNDKSFKRLADVIKVPNDDKKTSTDDKSNADKKDSKWKCKCPSAYQRLDDYIKLKDPVDKDDNGHTKVNANDTVDDLYNKIVSKHAKTDVKSNKDVSPAPVDDKRMDDIVDKVKTSAVDNKKVDDLPKQDHDDTVEDSLIKLVRYIFGR